MKLATVLLVVAWTSSHSSRSSGSSNGGVGSGASSCTAAGGWAGSSDNNMGIMTCSGKHCSRFDSTVHNGHNEVAECGLLGVGILSKSSNVMERMNCRATWIHVRRYYIVYTT